MFCLQNPSNQAAHQEASATLLAFRNSAAPIGVCQHVLQSSSSEQAKFQVGGATSSFREPKVSRAYPIRVAGSHSYMLCRLLSLCGMQLYVSGQPCQEMISALCGDMFCTMSSGMTAYCRLACPNPCHKSHGQHKLCSNESIPVCSQHIHAADRLTPANNSHNCSCFCCRSVSNAVFTYVHQ